MDRSPINFVNQIKAPLLILAGGHDPRCPHTEAEQVASAKLAVVQATRAVELANIDLIQALQLDATGTYDFVTPLGSILRFFGPAGGSSLTISDRSVMALNPTND